MRENAFLVCQYRTGTGQEHEETLEFVRKVDEYFDLGVVWVEALVNPEQGKGTSFKIVDFETASRNGEPFEAVISKYGLPNVSYLYCSRELKVPQSMSTLKHWKIDHIAIGIRADEYRRVSPAAQKIHDVVYPLIECWTVDKAVVKKFWKNMPFSLEIKDYQGNCKWCYKKSNRKLAQIAKDDISIFDFPKRMEQQYGSVKAKAGRSRKIFRGNRSTVELLASFATGRVIHDNDAGCSESCEFFSHQIRRNHERFFVAYWCCVYMFPYIPKFGDGHRLFSCSYWWTSVQRRGEKRS